MSTILEASTSTSPTPPFSFIFRVTEASLATASVIAIVLSSDVSVLEIALSLSLISGEHRAAIYGLLNALRPVRDCSLPAVSHSWMEVLADLGDLNPNAGEQLGEISPILSGQFL